MDLFELQTRANILVDKANAYEQSLTKENLNEDEVLAQQKYADIYCLRPVLKLLFGDTVEKKINRNLLNELVLPIYASSAPMWNTKFSFIPVPKTKTTYSIPSGILKKFSSSGTSDIGFDTNTGIISRTQAQQNCYLEYNFKTTFTPTDYVFQIRFKTDYASGNSRLFQFNTSSSIATDKQKYPFAEQASNTHFHFACNSSSGYSVMTAPEVTAGEWHTARIERDSSKLTKFFMDGIEYNSLNDIKNIWWMHFASGAFLRLFTRSNDSTNWYGSIDLSQTFFRSLDGTTDYLTFVDKTEVILNDEPDFESDKHEFMNSIDIMNNHNMIQLDATQKSLTYNNETYSDEELRTKQGINYLYSSNIQDALATESQIANMFKWNTTASSEIKDNTITTYSQVPGVVIYYIGQGGFDYSYSPSISHSNKSTLNSVSFEAPTYNGSLYLTQLHSPASNSNSSYIESQDIFDAYAAYADKIRFNLRMFIPGTHYAQGRLESPQQIWVPDIEAPEYIQHGTVSYNNSKYNYQSHALYHELVFKRRRSGAKENSFDFISTLESIVDNDPQGLAIRLALAKNKDYYVNRPWFNELNFEYDFDTSKLADKINEMARVKTTTTDSTDQTDTDRPMTDSEFYNQYKLDYETYATTFGLPL